MTPKHDKAYFLLLAVPVFVLIILIVLFISSPGQLPFFSHETANRYFERTDSILKESINSCSAKINYGDTTAVADLMRKVHSNELLLLHQQENLINDIRQETNNNIDKLNLWLSFAIGIMALLGVFVPIALQFRLKTEVSEQLKHISTMNEKTIKRECENLNMREKQRNDEFERIREGMEEQKATTYLRSTLIGLYIGSSNNIISDHPHRINLLAHFWENSVHVFSCLVNKCSHSACATNEQFIELAEALILLQSIINQLRGDTYVHRNREWNKVADRIHETLNSFARFPHTQDGWKKLMEKVQEIKAAVAKLEVPRP